MRRLFTVLFGILLLSVLVSTVSAGIIWPNWDEAAKYPDATGDQTGLTVEDMTICYVTHDAEYIYFRVEFAGGSIGDRTLLVYLDVDQNQATGDSGTEQDYGYDLHDLGAEWRIKVNSGFQGLYKWETNAWFGYPSQTVLDPGNTYIMLRMRLSDLYNPQFPMNILFISSATPGTDWNPNAGHLEYPVPRPVGGILIAVDKLTLLSPWVAVALAAVALTIFATKRRRRP